MSRRALFAIHIGGQNVTANFHPVLISLRVSDKAGTHSDTAEIELDDTGGKLILPKTSAAVMILLGWEDEGIRPVFEGTVDEVRSQGGRGGGRTLRVSAKGVDTKGKAKQPQQRHFDDKSVEDVLKEAGKTAGVDEVRVDPQLAKIKRPYLEMHDESFIHFGERLAREIGGNFKVVGKRAEMTKRDGTYTVSVLARWGENLHDWDIAPVLGRPRYKKARARWYDSKEAKWKETDAEIELDADAEHVSRYPNADEGEAKDRANSDKATSERDAGEGSVTIEGNTGAVPDGLCILLGARPGIDGTYRIEAVQHSYSRGGFTTQLDLKQPKGGAGTDSR